MQTSSSLDAGDWTVVPPEHVSIDDHGTTETVTASIPVPEDSARMFARLKVAQSP